MAHWHATLAQRHRGAVLPLVLVLTAVSGILAVALLQRSLQSQREATWSRSHLGLRLLAESAAEELFLSLEEELNQAGPIGGLLRTSMNVSGTPVELPGLAPKTLARDLARASRTSKVSLVAAGRGKTFLSIARSTPVAPHPSVVRGLIRCEVGVRLGLGRSAVTEWVQIERPYLVAPVTLPSLPDPIGQPRLLLAKSDSDQLSHFCPPGESEGPPVFAEGGQNPAGTLLELVTTLPPVGFQAVPETSRTKVEERFGWMAPDAIARWAPYQLSSAAELISLLARMHRAGRAGGGAIHVSSKEPISFEGLLAKVRGRYLISCEGPVQVGDIGIENPARDSVTILSSRRIVVTGREVHAALACVGANAEGVVLSRRCQIQGPVWSQRFPRGSRLTAQEFAECGFGPVAAGAELPATWIVLGSKPTTVVHRRD